MTNAFLIQKALEVKQSAYAPFSKFKVGAIVVTEENNIYTGCNIESSSYSLTVCAERVAIFKAISEGERRFSEIYIAADSQKFCSPCGACRQVLWDLAGNIHVIMINRNGNYKTMMLEELLPEAFDKKYFENL